MTKGRCCLLLISWLVLFGCSSNSRLSRFVLDGIPYPLQEVCADYCRENSLVKQEVQETAVGVKSGEPETKHSSHLPYEKKRCDDCHDKTKEEGLIVPRKQLCFHCHERHKGAFVHGPVAIGDCLACHVPHSSFQKPLLAAPPGEICSKCHEESRISAFLHSNAAKHLLCTDCHDPHAGEAEFFVK